MSSFTFGFNVKPRKAGGVSYDADAQAFFTAASITDTTQKSAVNQLVLDLKSYGVWTKCLAIYPIVGGSASSHAVNLKTPGTYNLTFSTGWTHASTGMTPNGTSAFADTSLAPTAMALNSIHGSVYLRLNNQVDGPVFSSEVATTFANGFYLFPKQTGPGNYSVRINDSTSDQAINSNNIQGLNIIIRTASNVKKYRIKTTQVFSSTTVSTARNTDSIYLGKARNNALYYTNSYAFLSFGDGLTDAEANNLNTAVQSYQTTLSRQV